MTHRVRQNKKGRESEMEKQDNDIEIKSVAQFVQGVIKIGTGKYRAKNTFFRGEADSTWEPKASLLRSDLCNPNESNGDVYVQMEYDMIREATKINPSMFDGCRNSIEKMVVMQHYGLPTRLLDVTTNPLIALYFACESKSSKDGKVLFVQKKPVGEDLANMIATLCEYYEDSIYESRELWTFLNILKKHHLYGEDMKKEIVIDLFENITKSFLYVHPYINERIKMQSGAFVFSAYMQPIFNKYEYQHFLEKIGNEGLTEQEIRSIHFNKVAVSVKNIFNERRFIIKSRYKKRILKELDLLGINEASVFPEPEHQMRCVKNTIIMSCMSIRNFNS